MPTTQNNDKSEALTRLYSATSKHSNYQVLPQILHALIDTSDIHTQSRWEIERWKFISDHVEMKNKRVVDIGANTGFFSFESLQSGAAEVTSIEGNEAHATFIAEASRILGLHQLSSRNEYIAFPDCTAIPESDVLILLNVLHHLGDDFGSNSVGQDQALELMKSALRNLASHTHTLIFQLGFNWKGNRVLPLFENGTKRELIDFVLDACKDHWEIEHIAIADKVNDRILFEYLNDSNIQRRDDLGEFLNRPLFILNSKKI